jgi:prepilin-type N-terminal cleavage/methylation domain-containing protein
MNTDKTKISKSCLIRVHPRSSVAISSLSGRSGTRGVTLIEMMVVVIIIAVIVSVSTPSVTAGIDAVRLSTATGTVASFLNSAVNRAERRRQPVELTISLKENRIRFVSTDAGSQRELTLPDGIVLEAVLPPLTDAEEGARRLLLMPGGAIPEIAIQLANHHGGSRIVRLDPMTGFPRVESVPTR